MENKYLAKIDYFCPEVQTGGYWYIFQSEIPPKLGVINNRPFESGPIEGHGCKKHYYSDSCDMDSSCNWQKILEVLPFTEEKAKELNAQSLDSLLSK